MIDLLIGELQRAIEDGVGPEDVDRHLDGVAAIMENHFAYEERELLGLLEALVLEASPSEVLGGCGT